MAKHNICAILAVFTLFMFMQINVNHGRELVEEEDELALEYMCLKNQKLAKIIVYAQDVAGGPNATSFEVALAAISTDDPASFGKVLVVDEVITAAPSGESEKLGKVQWIVSSTDRGVTALAMNFNIVFTAGKYNGSTLSIAGRNEVLSEQRALAVVGGTGVFRYTRGYAVARTYSSRVGEDSGVYFVMEYTVYATVCPSM